MNDQHKPAVVSSGVDALIARLRDEGVAEGKQKAEAIVAEAEAKARAILEDADSEARYRVETARKEADSLKAAGEEALKVAMRDLVLDLKSQLMRRFSEEVQRLVREQVIDQELLQRMILEIVGRMREEIEIDEEEPLEVILPREVVGLEDLRRRPEELTEGALSSFIYGIQGQLLRDGVQFTVADETQAGIRVRLLERDINIDVTEQAVAALLLEHLQPRFRAIMEGVVK